MSGEKSRPAASDPRPSCAWHGVDRSFSFARRPAVRGGSEGRPYKMLICVYLCSSVAKSSCFPLDMGWIARFSFRPSPSGVGGSETRPYRNRSAFIGVVRRSQTSFHRWTWGGSLVFVRPSSRGKGGSEGRPYKSLSAFICVHPWLNLPASRWTWGGSPGFRFHAWRPWRLCVEHSLSTRFRNRRFTSNWLDRNNESGLRIIEPPFFSRP
jgi:hypothetical protein